MSTAEYGAQGTPTMFDEANTPFANELLVKLKSFIEDRCIPGEELYARQHEELSARGKRWSVPPIIEELKKEAKALGLWNLFLPRDYAEGRGLTNVEYAQMAELMGHCHIASEACNCNAPDTGNMETLAKYGNAEQKKRWLEPLLNGDIRSVFLMTEPRVASSDAANIETVVERDGDDLVITGRKWWSSGACDPRCKIGILMCKVKTDKEVPRHMQQSMLLVPMDTPGIRLMRHLTLFGYDDAPHGHAEIDFDHVRVPYSNLILGEGRGFEISQGRLGPGRVHHCMRSIGVANRALDAMVDRSKKRTAFGRPLFKHGTVIKDIADSRIELEMGRLLVLHAARVVDQLGGKNARREVTMIKVAIPNITLKILDRAIQIHGGAGVCQDFFLAQAYAGIRTLRIADGPDEVHRMVIARQEIKQAPMFASHHTNVPEEYHSGANLDALSLDYSDPIDQGRGARL